MPGSLSIGLSEKTSTNLTFEFKQDAISAGIVFTDGGALHRETPIGGVMSLTKKRTVAYVNSFSWMRKSGANERMLVDYQSWIEGKEAYMLD